MPTRSIIQRKILLSTLLVISVVASAFQPEGIKNVAARQGSTQMSGLGTSWYVSPSGNNTWDCLSPASACRTVQAAINKASNGDSVFVAAGTYNENVSMKSGVNLIGAGASNTILSGPASVNGTVRLTSIANARLSGFTITVDAPSPGTDRGVVIDSFTDSTAIIENNIITNVQIGIYIWYPAAPIIQNNTFLGESDEQAVYIGNDGNFSPLLRNNIIAGYPTAIHVVDDGTHPDETPTPMVIFNDLWDNQTNFLGMQDQAWMNGNQSIDPLFVDRANRNLHLTGCSLAIDAGDPASPYGNEPEPNGGRIDMGAYGNTPEATSRGAGCPLPSMYVCFGTPGGCTGIMDDIGVPDPAFGTDFGSVDVSGGSVTNSYLIMNMGMNTLNLTGNPRVAVLGVNSADFVVPAQPGNPISKTNWVPFSITFNPSAKGLRSATISISSNDLGTSPYTFNIQGTGFSSTQYPLVVNKTGSGSGSVTSSPGGINCGPTCSASFLEDTVVTLSAVASNGSHFAGWSESGCSGTGTCVVSMTLGKSVTANFEQVLPILSGSGVTPDSTPFDFGIGDFLWSGAATGRGYLYGYLDLYYADVIDTSPCSSNYKGYLGLEHIGFFDSAAEHTFTQPTSIFFGANNWSCKTGIVLFRKGDYYGGLELTEVDADLNLHYKWWYDPNGLSDFSSLLPECHGLSLGHSGSGSDPVPSLSHSPGCPAGQYAAGESIALSASPAPGWEVGGWQGTIQDGSTSLSNTVSMPASAHSASVHYVATASFEDVPPSHWAYSWIERLYASGITTGCSSSPMQYCPEQTVTRAQMAVFLVRGTHGTSFVPPAPTGIFTDVPTTAWAAAFIEQLYTDGITTGCISAPLMYCPANSVTRAEMAKFLLRAKHGKTYEPPAAFGIFFDVPNNHWAFAWVEQLYAEGITTGCNTNPLMYCPEQAVTRAQMAAFLVRVFGLP